jgi:hypothetical protein
MKLFTIGDSLSQGFMSGAAARTDLCYSTLIAGALGLTPGPSTKKGTNYFYPQWPCHGLPANIEAVFREMIRKYGCNINGIEWLTALSTLNRVIDRSEDYYERGAGSANKSYQGQVPHFNNVSIWSIDVADSWLLTPEICKEELEKEKKTGGKDQWLGIPNSAFYRTALKVLDPNLDKNFTQLEWLEHHAKTEGVESLILWTGGNNALKPILTLKIIETPDDQISRPFCWPHPFRRKKGWNLWHPADFQVEYQELIRRIDEIMSQHNRFPDWKIFIATIPRVTVAPILKGFGPTTFAPGYGTLYKFYTYTPFKAKYALDHGIFFPLEQLLYIDTCIGEYNKIITEIVEQKNKEFGLVKGPYFTVDMCQTFDKLNLHRQGDHSAFEFPDYFASIDPPVDISYYHADTCGIRTQGGLISLDGIHPTAICQGLIAREFIKVMEQAGIQFKHSLNWPDIFNSDSLYQKPLSIMQEMYDHQRMAQQLVKLIRYYL